MIDAVKDGVEMLFLINHVEDACRYLQAQGLWKESCIFAKYKNPMTLEDYSEMAQKWMEHLILTNTQKGLCCLLALSQRDWDRTLKLLAMASQGHVAKQLEKVLEQYSIAVAKTTEQSPTVLRDEIFLVVMCHWQIQVTAEHILVV
ncbi:unnamed protein product [Enterobius vermicularis]|uniref:Vps16_C domain-containing protein n=1 Tax=Enterobius vermicularis TaxID=51028 RepID=A0A0N4UWB9_ENTVE|nr:unnamed protein product [Enterobius vermicularis]